MLASSAVAQDPVLLARAYAGNSNPANRSALLQYASTHKDRSGGIALLAIAGHDTSPDRYTLQAARERLPELADYVLWLSASAAFEGGDFAAAAKDAEAVVQQSPKSPLQPESALLAAKAYLAANTPARAVDVLRRAHGDLPQPDGDLALAGAFEAAHDPANAAAFYQRVWLEYPASAQAQIAEAGMAGAKRPSASALLVRATKLIEAREFEQARRDLTALAASSSGVEHDFALVRIGVADQRARKNAAALSYLHTLAVTHPEADAERLYYTLAAARRLNRLDVIEPTLERLARSHPVSEWRLQALVAAGDEYLVLNQPAQFEPFYKACYEQFPKSPQASYCHWQVVFNQYLLRTRNSSDLLRAHLQQYPTSEKASAAMYFLGHLAEGESDWGDARAWYQQIEKLFPNYYYAVLARERSSRSELRNAAATGTAAEFLKGITFPARALPASFQPLPSSEARFERARLLRSAALDEFAEKELRFGAKSSEQPEAFGLELARVASARSAPERAIRYLKHYAPGYLVSPMKSAPREFWTLSFPLPWRGPLENSSKEAGLDPFILAALIRQESEFDATAISRAKAYGLTQILPSTGRELGRRLNLRRFTPTMLFDPEINLRLGAQYLRTILNSFHGEWEPTLAAYNAGRSRAVAWLKRSEFRDRAEFVESIPFRETRNYVQIVLRNADLYRRLYAFKKDN